MNASSIKAVLFDKDGTLLDYQRTWAPINRAAALAAAAGDPALANRLMELGGMDPVSLVTRADSLLAAGNTLEIAEAWARGGARKAPDDLTRELDALFTGAAAHAIPVTDLRPLFRRLRTRGLRIGIASSDSAAAISRFVDRFLLRELVDFIAGYDSGHGTKPGPGMLLAFANAIGIPPSDIVVVGDNLHDMHMAQAGGAGLRVAVLTGTGTRETLSTDSDICLNNIEALEAALFQETSADGQPGGVRR